MVAVLAAFWGLQTLAGVLDRAWIKGTTDRNPLSYRPGDEIVFTLEPMGVEGNIPDGEYFLSWKRSDDYGKVESGEVPFSSRPFVYKTSLDKPGFVRLEAYVVDTNRTRFVKNTSESGKRKNVFFDGGAGVEPDKLVLSEEA